jgi:hypothetical protein
MYLALRGFILMLRSVDGLGDETTFPARDFTWKLMILLRKHNIPLDQPCSPILGVAVPACINQHGHSRFRLREPRGKAEPLPSTLAPNLAVYQYSHVLLLTSQARELSYTTAMDIPGIFGNFGSTIPPLDTIDISACQLATYLTPRQVVIGLHFKNSNAMLPIIPAVHAKPNSSRRSGVLDQTRAIALNKALTNNIKPARPVASLHAVRRRR